MPLLLGRPAAGWLAAGHAADVRVLRVVRSQARHPAEVRVAVGLSRLGEHAVGWLGVAAAGAVADRPRRREWLDAGATVAAGHALAVVVKRVVRRQRPMLDDLGPLAATPSGLTFPSAHAASAFAAAGVFSGLLPGFAWYPAAAVMAASRLYLGVHYPSDVIAGAGLGAIVARVRWRRR